jgi:DNA polymerase-1
MSEAPLILVDGSSYLYRAFHALPPLTNSKGVPTGAVKGVINMLRRMDKDFPGSTVVVIFDAKGKTFRDDIYPEYKAQRPPMPDELRCQIKPIHDIIRAMGLPLLIIDGVEADDVIGTLAHQATQQGIDVIISTGDKDMAQLVSPHVALVNTMTNVHMDEAGVIEKFGIPANLIIDFLALMGDKVDNIPGVPGVGEKTALGLLQNLGSLDAIYADLEAVRTLDFRGAKKMPEKLAEHKDSAYLSYLLATIKVDVELDFGPADFKHDPVDNQQMLELFKEQEFKTWVSDLENVSTQTATATATATNNNEAVSSAPAIDIEKHYDLILTQEDFDDWLARLKSAELIAFDTETTSLDYMEARVVGVSFAVEAGHAAYLPFAHDYMDAPQQLDEDLVLAALKPLLEDDNLKKVGQNLKYDRSVLLNHGIQLRGITYDTMLESYVLNSTSGRHDMDTLANKHLEMSTIKFEDIAGKGAKQLTFNQVTLEEAGPYAAEDADITLRLHQTLWPQLHNEPNIERVFTEIELPLLPILSDIERTGALLDVNLLGKQSIELGERLSELEKLTYTLAGEEFNLSSPKQLAVILFEKLELPVIKKTPKGAPSTAEEVLQELALDYELPKLLIEHRGLSKLKSTYTDKLPKMVQPATGRVHTSYHQAVTATGRLSSSDPNLQNIPIRSKEGRRIRQAFIAPKGHKIVAADYSQVELRIMAHLSGDQGLQDAFSQGLDVHKATAAEVFSCPIDQVTTEQRRSAKAINFGLIYGMSAFGLAKQLNVGRYEAQDYINLYFERYPGVQSYMDNTRVEASEQGYVETLKGRRLYLPEINSSNGMRRQAAERTAINAPMQGTAADIIKLAMISVDAWLKDKNLNSKVIMQVHDELVLEVPDEELEQVSQGIKRIMEDAMALSVPLVVDVGVGDNWDEAH